MCLFERDCLVVQADAEFEDAVADNAHRRHVAALLCRCLGLCEDVIPVAIVMMYSPSTVARIRAGELLDGRARGGGGVSNHGDVRDPEGEKVLCDFEVRRHAHRKPGDDGNGQGQAGRRMTC